MHNPDIDIDELTALFIADTPLIDVRAPVEFMQGSLPGAVNLPILRDEERALVGTTYKQQGSEAAVKLGYEMISGPVKHNRLQQWLDFIQQHPQVILYCFRGGKRSQITQQWLRDASVDRPLITGGYKRARQFLINTIDRFSQHHTLLVITGPTGSGKTRLIQEIKNSYPALDIEALARHRGSAFGGMPAPQPTQIDFENQLAVNLLKLEHAIRMEPTMKEVLVEDESRHTGKVYLPAGFFEHMRRSEIIWVDEPLESRVDNIFEDYILATPIGQTQQARRIMQPLASATEIQTILHQQALLLFDKYAAALRAISKKLGGVRFQEISQDLENARSDFLNRNEIQSNRIWITKLVKYYYDPLYLGSLQRRQVNPCFRGSRQAVLHYLQNHRDQAIRQERF
ncbi:tRNA 2-selenouridine(34) synthase MnmH [Nitrosomonas sp. HPC101]|uniref:tRNA 2-selenouridine(34) synthase MnmH n=1 Tax=Nitrosomonas sp. HPC101 TaxID=1658667 RepID=UPI00136DC49A|nr:tRNA 2-selenouridine(34) synthase MnmH [Nitrosomonas sp. HPC101]MXS85947.1 tRNA 2-selenouridine(34) synthase MnmH [Nitrosomonas sp. HPC101]